MAAVDGHNADIVSGAGSGSRRAGRTAIAVDGYGLEFRSACPDNPPIPTPPPVVYVQTSGPKVAAASIALGAGIVRPFRRTEHQDFANDAGVEEVLSCVGQLLGTPIGSLPWRVDFGCGLEQLRHKPRTADLQVFAMRLIDEALKKWEPRAQVSGVTLDTTAGPSTLALIVTVKIGTLTKSLTLQV